MDCIPQCQNRLHGLTAMANMRRVLALEEAPMFFQDLTEETEIYNHGLSLVMDQDGHNALDRAEELQKSHVSLSPDLVARIDSMCRETFDYGIRCLYEICERSDAKRLLTHKRIDALWERMVLDKYDWMQAPLLKRLKAQAYFYVTMDDAYPTLFER
jgi:hypothetical protein